MPSTRLQFVQVAASAQRKVGLWRAASIELSIGPEATDALVQAGIPAVLASLRAEVAGASMLIETYSTPNGPLGRYVELVGSLLDPGHLAQPELLRL